MVVKCKIEAKTKLTRLKDLIQIEFEFIEGKLAGLQTVSSTSDLISRSTLASVNKN